MDWEEKLSRYAQSRKWEPMDLAIESSTVHQRVYARLCQLLASGVYGPGERLDETTLAKRMGVSRTPLREAISWLASEGVVQHRPYQGNFVRTFTAKQVHDLYEVRKSLESLAVQEACTRMGEAELGKLRQIVETCHGALDAGDMDEFEAADRRFHQEIAEQSGNEMLIKSLHGLGLHIQLVRHLANKESSLRAETKEHRNGIIDAFTAGDPHAAAEMMRLHISEVQTAVVEQLPTDADEPHTGY